MYRYFSVNVSEEYEKSIRVRYSTIFDVNRKYSLPQIMLFVKFN